VVSLSRADLDQLLREAVTAGVAQAYAAQAAANAPVAPEPLPDWSDRDFLGYMIARTRWTSEREIRSAIAWLDKNHPAEPEPTPTPAVGAA
jgi:hypothetical protein